MQNYDYTIHHIEGKNIIRADALSRREGEENKKEDNKNIVVLPEERFRLFGSEETWFPYDLNLTKEGKERFLNKGEEIQEIDKSKAEVWMKEFHDSLLARHPGVKRMKKLMNTVVRWEGMEEDIRKYVEGCQDCQRNNLYPNNHKIISIRSSR